MTFQKDAPRKPDDSSPSANAGAKVIIEIPDQEATKKNGDAIHDHEPHSVQDLGVANILVHLTLLGRNG